MRIFNAHGLPAAFLCAVLAAIPASAAKAQAISSSGAQAPLVTTTLNPRGAWSPKVSYVANDLVTLRNSSWRALRASKGKLPGQTLPSTGADWALFAGGLNPIGGWKAAATFQRNDLVFFNGSTWRGLRTNLNKAPGSSAADWLLFAAKGATGARGPTGLRGLQGPAGPNSTANGSQFAPVINFTSSPDTGIFSPGGGKIALAENGALFLHDIGSSNTALGLGALGLNGSGSQNTALGARALVNNDTGSNNTALGESALRSNADGSSNTAVGNVALFSNIGGSFNTAVGGGALRSNISGSDNTAVGRNALTQNTANYNTAVGRSALVLNTTGCCNTAVGRSALVNNTVGFLNSALGTDALFHNTEGTHNTAIGFDALTDNTTASENSAVGNFALGANTTGARNTAMGVSALESNVGGNDNTAVGMNALNGSANGSSNIAIGFAAGSLATAPSNSIFLGNQGLAADTATIKIGTQGTQTTAFMAGISGVTVANSAAVLINTTTGQLGTIISSRRYKEDIRPMGAMSDMLAKLRPVAFRYKKPFDNGSKPIQYGLIAEEVAETFPYLAVFNEGGQPETVSYHLLPTFLLEGFQEQQRIIAAQAGELAELRAGMATERERITALQAELESAEAKAGRIAALKARLGALEAALKPPVITTASDIR